MLSSRAETARERNREADRIKREAESSSTRERRLAGHREQHTAGQQNERLLATEGDGTASMLQVLSPTERYLQAVSYTHLTLPTILLV